MFLPPVYFTHSWGRYWWASGHFHMPVGPAHCTSGAIYWSETSSTLAWGRKVPSLHGVPREGCTRVFPVERLCTSREGLHTLLPFRPKSYLAAAAESESVKQEVHTTHYTTALGASHRPVFSHHTTAFKNWLNDSSVYTLFTPRPCSTVCEAWRASKSHVNRDVT